MHTRTLNGVAVEPVGSRQERKQRTRQALLDAALRAEESLASLSLREVTREVGIVPTAFYRHFASMDELGVVLVEESMRTLRAMLREARRSPGGDAIRGSVAILVNQVDAYAPHFRFLLRERHGGVEPVRRAIHGEMRLLGSELATDLGRYPGMTRWSADDLRMAADLMVGGMLSIVTALLDVGDHPDDRAEVVSVAERQLRLIVLGMSRWTSPRNGVST